MPRKHSPHPDIATLAASPPDAWRADQCCRVPGCGRPTSRAAAQGVSELYCRHHLEHRRRHGSPFRKAHTARELEAYRKAARTVLIKLQRQDDPTVRSASRGLAHLMEITAILSEHGAVARNITDRRAHLILSRLYAKWQRETSRPRRQRTRGWCSPEGILATVLAVHAIIQDDPTSHKNSATFRFVNIAKHVHRLASGDGVDHGAARRSHSAGLKLRRLGYLLDLECWDATREHLEAVLAEKRRRFPNATSAETNQDPAVPSAPARKRPPQAQAETTTIKFPSPLSDGVTVRRRVIRSE